MSEAKTVAIIGAGPVGLAAAAHVLERGLQPIVLEAGDAVGLRDATMGPRPTILALGIQHRQGGGTPVGDDRLEFSRARQYPTGAEMVERYLEPLAAHDRAPSLASARRATSPGSAVRL